MRGRDARVTAAETAALHWAKGDNGRMLRDKNLIPLSHQHQHALAMCVRLDRALVKGDADLNSWQEEIAGIWESEIPLSL